MFEEIYVWNEEWENEINMNKVNYCMSLLFFLTVNPLMGKSIYLSIYIYLKNMFWGVIEELLKNFTYFLI